MKKNTFEKMKLVFYTIVIGIAIVSLFIWFPLKEKEVQSNCKLDCKLACCTVTDTNITIDSVSLKK